MPRQKVQSPKRRFTETGVASSPMFQQRERLNERQKLVASEEEDVLRRELDALLEKKSRKLDALKQQLLVHRAQREVHEDEPEEVSSSSASSSSDESTYEPDDEEYFDEGGVTTQRTNNETRLSQSERSNLANGLLHSANRFQFNLERISEKYEQREREGHLGSLVEIASDGQIHFPPGATDLEKERLLCNLYNAEDKFGFATLSAPENSLEVFNGMGRCVQRCQQVDQYFEQYCEEIDNTPMATNVQRPSVKRECPSPDPEAESLTSTSVILASLVAKKEVEQIETLPSAGRAAKRRRSGFMDSFIEADETVCMNSVKKDPQSIDCAGMDSNAVQRRSSPRVTTYEIGPGLPKVLKFTCEASASGKVRNDVAEPITDAVRKGEEDTERIKHEAETPPNEEDSRPPSVTPTDSTLSLEVLGSNKRFDDDLDVKPEGSGVDDALKANVDDQANVEKEDPRKPQMAKYGADLLWKQPSREVLEAMMNGEAVSAKKVVFGVPCGFINKLRKDSSMLDAWLLTPTMIKVDVADTFDYDYRRRYANWKQREMNLQAGYKPFALR